MLSWHDVYVHDRVVQRNAFYQFK
jgi:hypothetical protein